MRVAPKLLQLPLIHPRALLHTRVFTSLSNFCGSSGWLGTGLITSASISGRCWVPSAWSAAWATLPIAHKSRPTARTHKGRRMYVL